MPKNNVTDLITDQQDTQEIRRFNVSRDQVLARLWEIANMDPERTRNSMSAQVKALSMIVAIEGLIPDKRAVSAQNKPAPLPTIPPIYVSAAARSQQAGETVDSQPSAAEQESTDRKLQSAPASADNPPPPAAGPTPDPCESIFPGLNPSPTASSPYPSRSSWVPDTRDSFSIPKHPFGRRR
jgi:hypothetical protein